MTDLVEKMVDAVTTWPINGRADLIDAMQAALAAIRERHIIVPKKPTPEMHHAAIEALSGGAQTQDPKAAAWDSLVAYRAMIEEGEVK
ncbi:hypothetical protein [Ponticaulis profundi]|uniref:Uncharacterized protein n=1 Tax=Ponticaulis profundi TaxID=2665222 RepID=A0ABW1S7X3_9PROT